MAQPPVEEHFGDPAAGHAALESLEGDATEKATGGSGGGGAGLRSRGVDGGGTTIEGVWMPALLVGLVSGAGAAILGGPCPEWSNDRWVQGGPLRLSELRGKVVLLRFFMESDCPYCRATAPALNELHRELGPRGLVVVGMYTPKPKPRPTATEEVQGHVAAYGFAFPVAVDDEWGALRRLWLDRVPEADFTSASLLVDKQGLVRHVHPGGVFSKDAPDPQARRDYEALRAAIERLLAEP